LAKGSALASLAAMILAEGRARRHPSIAVEALAEAFFWLLVETRPIESLATPFRHHLGKSVFRRRLYEYFALNLREKPGMSAMAAELGMSERSLHARCRAVLGASPARAFSAYRIHEAKRFLARGLQVQEVSRALGFVDPFHFSKVFKRHLGFSPSRFSHDRTS
jgi:AraC-like DNA-binding protein